MVDVCLVSMPYAAIQRPSIALGLLKASLTQKGIESIALYPNIWFAEEIGLYKYAALSESPSPLLMGEWTFSGAAFPDFQPNHTAYLSAIASDKDLIKPHELEWVRQKVTGFIERVAHSILELQPRIVSCSSMFQQHCASLALLRRIRELDPDIITLMGGANCEGPMGLATHREFTWVDVVASGEGDDLFPKLCRKLLDKGRDIEPSELPYGVLSPAHRRLNLVATEAPRASVQDLDRVPIPDYNDYFQTLHRSQLFPYIKPGLPVETSRGCWWGQKQHCTFCGLNGNGMTYRSKSPTRVVREFVQLSQQYGLRKFLVVDNILDIGHIKTVLPIFAALPEPYKIFYETKANLKRQHMQQLTEAGVNAIQPGIESMHDSALKLLNKGNSAAINVQLLKWAREFGIAVIWNFLAGIPGESSAWYAEVLEWLPWIVHLQPPSRLGTIRYDRFSLYHERAVDYGLALSPNRAYFHVYPLSPEAMADLAYYFEEERHLDDHECAEVNGRKFDGKGSRFSSEQIELGKWVERWIELFKSETPPVLQTIDDDGERLRIIDTRPCATDGEITLEGLAYQVYRACDRVLTQRELIDALRRNCGIDVSWSDIQPVADELVSRRILLAQNGRLLNLAVRGSMPPLPNYRELPLGYLDILSFLHDARKQLESQLQQSIL
mgnify:CR=1 FL=1